MAEVKLSPQQELGVHLKGADILVSAAAGSGKTFVLVERILNRIMDEEHPCDIDQFLLVTYTKAAAAEMRLRIAARIRSALAQKGEDRHLQRQLTLLHKASINTVHSFCADLIRSNFHLLGVPHNFRICEEAEADLLKDEVLQEVVEDAFDQQEGEGFYRLAEMLAGDRSDDGLVEGVRRVYESSQSQLWPEAWVEEIPKAYAKGAKQPLEKTMWGKELLSQAKEALDQAQQRAQLMAERLEGIPDLESRRQNFLSDGEKISALRQQLARGFDAAREGFANLKLDRLATVRGYDKGELNYQKAVRDDYKKDLTDLQKGLFSMDSKEYQEDIQHLLPAVQALCQLVKEFSQRYRQRKLEKNMLTFSDLEHYAVELLVRPEGGPTDLAKELQQNYIEVMVDEYQDTNAIQSAIFSAISHGNLFMVGDVKQSIYKFRQAQPQIFAKTARSFALAQEGQFEAEGNSKILFTGNFRSRPQVLEAANFIFRQIMSRELGEVDYTKEEALVPKADYPESDGSHDTELWIIEKKGEDAPEGQEQEEQTEAQMEAMAIAQRIHQLMGSFQVYDAKTKERRPLQYSDIAILLRSQKGRALTYEQVLGQEGIPSYSEEAETYLESVEVQVMLSLLQIIDNPRQDIPLIAAMRSSMFGFTEDELLAIRLVQPEGMYYDALTAAADQGNTRAAEFLRRLEGYRREAKEQPLDSFLWYLYEDTGYYYQMLSMENGAKRAGNLKMLYEYARQYEQGSYQGLFHFVGYINHIMELKGDLLPSKTADAAGDGVRIMTIHKSKGLEFPICFVAGCGKGFNQLDLRGDLLIHDQLLLGFQMKDMERKITYPTYAKEAIKAAIEKENLSEEERVLYVALTRAKEKLILVGCCNSAEKLMQKIAPGVGEKKVSVYTLKKAGSYLEWLAAALLYHPDGGVLRQYLVEDVHPRPCSVGVQIRTVAASQVGNLPQEEPQEEQISLEGVAVPLPPEEDHPLSRIPSKLSVTELKGKRLDEELQEDAPQEQHPLHPIYDTPRFMAQQEGMTPAQKGTALHLAMQFLNYEAIGTQEDIQTELDRLVEQELITKEQAQACNLSDIWGFFESPLGRQMKEAKKVYREEKFNLMVPAGEIYPKLTGEAAQTPLLIQGVMDCFFITQEGKAVLIDFKTDRIPKGQAGIAKERYGTQLAVYKRAIEEIYGYSVEKTYLYLFRWGQALAMEESDEAREDNTNEKEP